MFSLAVLVVELDVVRVVLAVLGQRQEEYNVEHGIGGRSGSRRR